MKAQLILIVIVCLPAFFCIPVLAQAPVNDDCSGAIVVSTVPFGITCSSNISASTLNATASLPAPACAADSVSDDDTWYSFTANTATVVIRISNAVSIPSGSANIGVEFYSGSCGTLASVSCINVVAFGNGFRVVNGFTPGVTYFVRFWSTSLSLDATFNFCIQDVPPVINDECSAAIPIVPQAAASNCAIPVAANTTGATRSLPDISSCTLGSHDDDIWYSFTATMPSLTLRFSSALFTITNSTGNLGYALYDTSCPVNNLPVACSDHISFGSGSALISGLTVGTTYFLRLFSLGDNNFMSFNFCLQESGVVPVKIESFTAVCQNDKNIIRFTTATEINSDFFTVERGTDGEHFEKLASLKASASAGTGAAYSVTDQHPFPGKSFYRLMQTDKDGRESYDKIIAVNCAGDGNRLLVYPNPASDILFIKMPAAFKNTTIKILSPAGAVVWLQKYRYQAQGSIPVKLNQLFPGFYLLQIVNENGETEYYNFIKR